ncbi:hypothetical protein HYDPIDRAFT_161006 [Hydnomerulius pinastri MD-312]|uniref:Glutathione transferase n=1 Tax=Hydnomerulius pinastri MD-312 TaxID=994086 RepID=A0A0C9W2T1_9AGAM|nr:hypothetical protein HYDPIDRAFT_161006 [Hydnomerulius pinastri MD-312]
MPEQITLYGFRLSPFSEKVELALKEGKIAHTYVDVNLFDKPAYFAAKVTSIGKVPAITYGGPTGVSPEDPSPLSTKLSESNVLLEFIADAYPEANLMPTSPTERAKVRFFMDAVSTKLSPAYFNWAGNREEGAEEAFIKAIEFVQDLLHENAEFAVGNSYTIADACITPYADRLLLQIATDIGKFPVGNGLKLGELLSTPKYAKYLGYVRALANRPVTKDVFNEEYIKTLWSSKIYARA